MPEQPYAGRHRGGRHRAPSRLAARTGAVLGGGATSCAIGVVVLAVTAAGGPGDAASATAAPAASASPAILTAAAASREAQREKEDGRAELATVRAAQAQRVSRSRARAVAKTKQKQQAAEALRRAHAWVSPLRAYTLTSGFGPRWGRQHQGLDLAAPTGTRIGSLSSGTVIFAGSQSGYGNKVEVRHWDGTISYYAHMSSIAVTVGQSVAPGDKVGEVGNTGRSTGPHLHLQVLPAGSAVDGYAWLDERGVRL